MVSTYLKITDRAAWTHAEVSVAVLLHLEDMRIHTAWDCEGIRWAAGLVTGGWWASLALPWASMLDRVPLPTVWRANFYRIDRPRGAPPEYSAWSPTLADPPEFHLPARFGVLELE